MVNINTFMCYYKEVLKRGGYKNGTKMLRYCLLSPQSWVVGGWMDGALSQQQQWEQQECRHQRDGQGGVELASGPSVVRTTTAARARRAWTCWCRPWLRVTCECMGGRIHKPSSSEGLAGRIGGGCTAHSLHALDMHHTCTL